MKLILSAVSIALLAQLAPAQEWSRFRGPNGSGVSTAKGLPVRFGPEENLQWKAEVPFGASSPVVAKSAVFVTGSDDESLFVTALSRKSGETLWSRAIERDRTEEVFKANDAASPSPVTDGDNVYAFFPELGLISLDGQGAERWRLPLGPFLSHYGMSGSPILAGDTLVLVCDQQLDSFIVGVDAATGKERWKTERKGIIECWTTPLLYPAHAPTQVVVFGSYYVTSHSIETGEELWRMKGFGYTPVCSPVLAGDRLYVSVPDHSQAGVPKWSALAGDDANGDGLLDRSEMEGDMVDHFGWIDVNRDDFINEEEWTAGYDGMNNKDYGLAAIDLSGDEGPVEVWRYKKGLPSIASPLLYQGVIYLMRDSGLVTLVDAKNGKLLARERLPEGMGECWPSPIAGDGKIYVANNAGRVAVIEAGAEWNVLVTNDLGEDCLGTPAIGGDALFVRTRSALWSFTDLGRKKP